MRILVVEDNADSRNMLLTMLQSDGHDVFSATNGEEAWRMFEAEGFPVVITDWLMPDIDGLELCRRIRAAPSPQYSYVLLLTALQGKANYLTAMTAGVDDFMAKPWDADELRARLIVAERIVGLQNRVKRLEGVLPTCMYCKKIRDEGSRWVNIEQYISQRSEASFTHGVCPSCYDEVVKPELDRAR